LASKLIYIKELGSFESGADENSSFQGCDDVFDIYMLGA
jgi:hypothetical protein